MPPKTRSQTTAQKTPKSSHSTPVQSRVSTPVVTMSTAPPTPGPKIPKFSGKDDGISIQAFLGIFDWAFDKLTDDKEKMLKLVCFLEGDAADFFGTDIVPVSGITWDEVKVRLTSRYGHSEVPPVMAAIQRTLRSSETIRQYYDDKTRILRRMAGLTEAERSDHLTHGLPDAYRSHFYGRRFTTTTDWLSCAQDIEADLNRQSNRRHQSTHFTDSKSTQAKPFQKKPRVKIGEGKCLWPCKFCKELGLLEFHWNKDCPNLDKLEQKPKYPEVSTGTNSYTNLSVQKSKAFDGVSPVLISASIGRYPIKAFLDTGSNVNLISLDFAKRMKMSVDRNRASCIKSIAGLVMSPGVVTFWLTIDGVTKRIEARVLKSFEWTLLLSLPTQADFDITIETRQRKAYRASEPFCYHAQAVESEPSVLLPTPEADGDVAERRPYSNSVPSDSVDKVLHSTLFNLIKDFQNLFSKFTSHVERIERENTSNFLIGDVPVLRTAYRQSFHAADDTARQVKARNAKGLIRKSPSAFTSPSTLADPKDGSSPSVNEYQPVKPKSKSSKKYYLCQHKSFKLKVPDSSKAHQSQLPKSPEVLKDVLSTTQSRKNHWTCQGQDESYRFSRRSPDSRRTADPYSHTGSIHRPGECGDSDSPSPMTSPSIGHRSSTCLMCLNPKPPFSLLPLTI